MTVTITALFISKILAGAGLGVGAIVGFFAFVLTYGLSGKPLPSLGFALAAAALNWLSLALYTAAALVWVGGQL